MCTHTHTVRKATGIREKVHKLEQIRLNIERKTNVRSIALLGKL